MQYHPKRKEKAAHVYYQYIYVLESTQLAILCGLYRDPVEISLEGLIHRWKGTLSALPTLPTSLSTTLPASAIPFLPLSPLYYQIRVLGEVRGLKEGFNSERGVFVGRENGAQNLIVSNVYAHKSDGRGDQREDPVEKYCEALVGYNSKMNAVWRRKKCMNYNSHTNQFILVSVYLNLYHLQWNYATSISFHDFCAQLGLNLIRYFFS